MMKFETESEIVSLEMCWESGYMPLYLNRQSILLLWNWGVSEKTILELREEDSDNIKDTFQGD